MRNRQRPPRGSLTGLACCLLPCALALAAASCARPRPALPALAPVEQLRSDVIAATRSPGVERGTWAVLVYSLDRDERLIDVNSRSLLLPASLAKLVTLATAAEAVGWNHRYATTLYATGPIAGGTLQGDLVVVGSGDPSIGGRGGNDFTPWIAALRALGIRRIDGRVVGDDDALEEPRPQLSWAWDDLGYTYGAIFGALNFGENRTTVTVTPGHVEGAPTTVALDPDAGLRALANRTVTGAPGSPRLVWPEQRPGEPFLTVAGSLPAGSPPETIGISVGNPTIWFASALRRHLVRAGIEVTGEAVDVDDLHPRPALAGATPLYTHYSRPLAEIAVPMLKDSINVYAEGVLRLNVPPGVFITNDAALEGLRGRLERWGVPEGSQHLVDGSGLSRRDLIAPEALLVVLRRMHDPSGASPFLAALPVAGVDGTLAGRMRGTPAERNVRAKTGSLANVRGLAGYVTTGDGERLAFIVIVNNFEGPAAAAVEAVDAIASQLASFSRRPQ